MTSNKEGKKMGKRKEREIKWKRRRGKGKEGERWMCASWQSASNTTTTLPVLGNPIFPYDKTTSRMPSIVGERE